MGYCFQVDIDSKPLSVVCVDSNRDEFEVMKIFLTEMEKGEAILEWIDSIMLNMSLFCRIFFSFEDELELNPVDGVRRSFKVNELQKIE